MQKEAIFGHRPDGDSAGQGSPERLVSVKQANQALEGLQRRENQIVALIENAELEYERRLSHAKQLELNATTELSVISKQVEQVELSAEEIRFDLELSNADTKQALEHSWQQARQHSEATQAMAESLSAQAAVLEKEQELCRRELDTKKAQVTMLRERILDCQKQIVTASDVATAGLGDGPKVAPQFASDDKYSAFVHALEQAARACSSFKFEPTPLLIFLDGVDSLVHDYMLHDLAWLPLQLPSNCKLVCTMSASMQLGEIATARLADVPRLELTPIEADSVTFVAEQLLHHHHHRKVTPDQGQILVTSCLTEIAGSNIPGRHWRNVCLSPLHLVLAASEAAHWAAAAWTTTVLAADTAGMAVQVYLPSRSAGCCCCCSLLLLPAA